MSSSPFEAASNLLMASSCPFTMAWANSRSNSAPESFASSSCFFLSSGFGSVGGVTPFGWASEVAFVVRRSVSINHNFPKKLNIRAPPILLGEIAHRNFSQIDLNGFGQECRVGFGCGGCDRSGEDQGRTDYRVF